MALQGSPYKKLAPIHSVKSGTLQNACSTRTKSGLFVGLGEKCSYAHRQVDEQPNKRSQKNGEHHITIGQRMSRHGAAKIFIDFADELKLSEASPMCSIHKRAVTRHANIQNDEGFLQKTCWYSRCPK